MCVREELGNNSAGIMQYKYSMQWRDSFEHSETSWNLHRHIADCPGFIDANRLMVPDGFLVGTYTRHSDMIRAGPYVLNDELKQRIVITDQVFLNGTAVPS